MFVSDEVVPYIFSWKMEKTRSMREEVEVQVFTYRQSRHFSCVNIMIKVLFPTCTLTWRFNFYVSRQGKSRKRRNESTLILLLSLLFVALHNTYFYFNCFWLKLVLRHLLYPKSLFKAKKDNSVFTTVRCFQWQLWEIREKLQPLTSRIVRKISGTTRHETQMLPNHKGILLLKSLRR